MNTAGSFIIFGGTGFIGTHLAQHFLRENQARHILLVDLAEPRNDSYAGCSKRDYDPVGSSSCVGMCVNPFRLSYDR